MTILLTPAPKFNAVLSLTGSVVADSTVINTTNYPVSRIFSPSRGAPAIQLFWYATGTVAGDFVDLQLLIYDSATGNYVCGPTAYGISPRVVVKLETNNADLIAIRVLRASVASATDLTVLAASVNII